jgi:hypothetical protein
VQYGGAGFQARPANNSLAVASMICGIAGIVLVWFCGLGVPPAIVALITGFLGRSQINESGGVQGGSGMALAGIITGAAAIAVALLFLVLQLVFGTVGAILSSGSGG